MIEVKEIKEKSIWEKFNLSSANPTFLQSWAWGDFQKSLDRDIYRLGVYKNGSLVGVSLIFVEKAKVASFLYCPGGPVFTNWSKQHLDPWLTFVSQIAKEKNLAFLRADPRKIEKPAQTLLRQLGFVPAPEYTQPRCTALIDLSKDEEELLSKMSITTRYNVKASQRKGVKVKEGKLDEIKIFLDLLRATAQRKVLVLPVEQDYHKKQFETLNKEGLMRLFIAEYQGQPLSAALAVFYGETAYYLHAASSDQLPKLRASYPLVWQTILEAKKRNLKQFDFWGVAESDDPKHSWAGVTSFKLSFGAERACYVPPFDLPYKTTYRLIRLLETYRRPLQRILRFGRRLWMVYG